MRQFLLGIVIAALLWWGYGATLGKPAEAAPTDATAHGEGAPATPPAGSPAPAPDLDSALGGKVPPPALAAAAPAKVAVAALLERLAGGDAAAAEAAFAALAARGTAPLPATERQQLAAALAGPAGDFAAQLARLGAFNTFLHSAEGRAQAGKALAAAMAPGDGEAVAAGSQLLALCLRGPIAKGDVEARKFVDEAYRQHRVHVDRWLCDPQNVAGARSHTVAPGETLDGIAKRFRRDKILVDDGTIAVLNRIHNPNAVRAGQKIKIPQDPVSAVVEKRSFSLAVMVGRHLLRLYWVGHGENDKTPVTEFTVLEKQPRPQWTSPDGNVYDYGHPKNILGEYFVKFGHDSYTGFGAHGTPDPGTIGTMSSAGCIRMLAPDIAELFRILPRGAQVVIRASAPSP